MIIVKRTLAACVLACLLIPLGIGLAQGASITVNSTADVIADDGQCTLREAIIAANTNTPSSDTTGSPCAAGSNTETDTIYMPLDAVISLTIPGTEENGSATGDLDIADNAAAVDLILAAPSTAGIQTSISQNSNPDDRVLEILSGAVVEMNLVAIHDGNVFDIPGNPNASGGGILNGGTLTLNYSQVSGNGAPNGGGIASFGYNGLILNGTEITQNWTSGYGGGISMHSGTITSSSIVGNSAQYGGGFSAGFSATVDGSYIAFNQAAVSGGGIYNGGMLTIRNGSTIEGNNAQSGGGIRGGGATDFDASTLTGNSASSSGGGMFLINGSATFRNGSVVSYNSAQAGGGIFNDGLLTVTNTRFQQNSASFGSGGAIFHMPIGSTQVTNSVFVGNTSYPSVSGSAIHVNGGAGTNEVSVTASCLMGNSAYAFANTATNSQNASGNWWGSPGGPNSPGADTTSGAWNTSGFLTSPAAACNLITNGTMQADANGDNRPDGFTYSGLTAQDGRVCVVASDCVLRLNANGNNKTAAQTITQSGEAGDRYTLRIDHEANKITGSGPLRVEALFYSGSTQTGQHVLTLNSGTHGWQQLSLPITAAGSYDRIVVVVTFGKNKGTLQVDDLSLVREP